MMPPKRMVFVSCLKHGSRLINKLGLINNHLFTIESTDDLLVLLSGKFAGTISDRMQEALCLVQNCFNDNELKVNPPPPKNVNGTIHLYRNRIINGLKISNLYGTEVNKVFTLKYLCVWLDYNLDWSTYMLTIQLTELLLLFSNGIGLLEKKELCLLQFYTLFIQ